MKITKSQLKQIIKEELLKLQEYGGRPYDPTVAGDYERARDNPTGDAPPGGAPPEEDDPHAAAAGPIENPLEKDYYYKPEWGQPYSIFYRDRHSAGSVSGVGRRALGDAYHLSQHEVRTLAKLKIGAPRDAEEGRIEVPSQERDPRGGHSVDATRRLVRERGEVIAYLEPDTGVVWQRPMPHSMIEPLNNPIAGVRNDPEGHWYPLHGE